MKTIQLWCDDTMVWFPYSYDKEMDVATVYVPKAYQEFDEYLIEFIDQWFTQEEYAPFINFTLAYE